MLKRLTKWARVRRKGNEKIGPLSFKKLMGQKKIAENSESLKKKIRMLNSKNPPALSSNQLFSFLFFQEKNHMGF